jgi:succinoglycan biosynthesis transport protein ExoP
MAGIALSFGAAVLREAIDRVFRSKRQVEQKLDGPCLAVLPLLTSEKPPKKLDTIVPATVLAKRQIDESIYRQVIEYPLSAFAEGFRSIKVAADLGGSRVIGVTSTVPGEGKSTVASNLAQSIANAGKRVILLDGDLRNPSLSRAFASNAKAGILEVMNGQIALKNAAFSDKRTFRFLPSVGSSRLAHTNDILGSDAFKNLLEGLRKEDDYVIVDLSPVAPVADVRATTHMFDSYIYVIEWGRTHTNLVEHQVFGFPEIRDRLLGFVLNKANPRVLERYETYGRPYYQRY